MTTRTLARIAVLAGLLGLGTTAASQDWPQWRGPNRDGAVMSFKAPTAWPETLVEQWKLDVGLGYATPVEHKGCFGHGSKVLLIGQDVADSRTSHGGCVGK